MKMQLVKKNFLVYLSAVIGDLLGFSAGIAFSWTSSMLPKLSTNSPENPLGRPATVLEQSWIAGCISLGAILGPLLFTPIIDKLGRKKALLILGIPFITSLLMLAFSKTIFVFFLARFILGLGTGSVFTALPTYLVEIAEDYNRGVLLCMMSVFIASGILFTYAIGPVLSVQNFCLVSLIPVVVFVVLFSLLAPESPQFLASIKDHTNMKRSIVRLRRHKTVQEIEEEISIVKKTVEELRTNQNGIRDLFQVQELRRGLVISLGLITMQQLAGITAVISYMQPIFEDAGSGISPELSVIIVGTIQVVITILTSSVVDILGRKLLFVVSSIFCCISLVVLGLYFFLKNHSLDTDRISWLPVSSLILYIVAFNIGLGPLPWTLMAELFPSTVKATASTLTAITSMTGNFIIMLCFPSLSTFFGLDLTFWFFGMSCLGTAVVVWLCVPETKGKSLIEIQELLRGNCK